jgi:hypothetical protein
VVSEIGMHRGRFEHPPVHAPTTLGGDDAQRLAEEFGSDARHFVAVVRGHDDVE